MPQLESHEITALQKQFIIFVGEAVCSIGEAEQRGLVEVHVRESGDVDYKEVPQTEDAARH